MSTTKKWSATVYVTGKGSAEWAARSSGIALAAASHNAMISADEQGNQTLYEEIKSMCADVQRTMRRNRKYSRLASTNEYRTITVELMKNVILDA